MNTYCIIYKTKKGGNAEIWLHATSASAARTIFREQMEAGELDYEATGEIVETYMR